MTSPHTENLIRVVAWSIIAAVGLAVPTALVAQEKLMARGGGSSFSVTIQGTRQGVFAAARGGAMAGLRFGYGAKSPRDVASGESIARVAAELYCERMEFVAKDAGK